MKKCTGCLRELESSEFAKNKGRKDGLQQYCKQCKKERDAQYYRTHKSDYAIRKLGTHTRVRRLATRYKQLKGCQCCKEKDVCCLEFHHLDPSLKDKNVSMLITNGKTWEFVKQEIRKCIVVCANCHKKIHAGKINVLSA